MPLYALVGLDRSDALDRRMGARQDHLAYLGAQSHVVVKLAGPMLDEQGSMIGSLLVVEAPNRAAVEAFRAGDPYGKVDLFKSFDVREFRPGVIDQF